MPIIVLLLIWNDPTCIELTFEKDPSIVGENPVLPHPLDQKSFSYLEDKN